MIRDINLAEEGKQRIAWVEKFMPVLNTLKEEFSADQSFKGKTVVMSIHLEAKTAYLALTLKAAGTNVICTGSNPLSTQDPIAAALVDNGITVYAWHGCTDEEYTLFLNKALDHKPDIIIDDGGDLVHLLHTTRKDAQVNLIGGSEETTTGVHRLKILEKAGDLEFPMIAVNDSYCKYLFDNRYGTGQSAWDGIIRSTNLTITGKTVVIAGYGWCGKGVSMRSKGLGAHVIVTEVDPIKAIEAVMDGFEIMPMDEAAKVGAKVCFHIEPFNGRSPQTVRENIQYIVDTYGDHPAFYRTHGKPLFFIYDSYLIKPAEWAKLFAAGGEISVRNTKYDGLFIGLTLKESELPDIETACMDGFYTYFAATGFTNASTPANWKSMQQWAKAHNKLFIPSVGPGYIDTRIRPWNGSTTRDRENGKYYDDMYKAAIESGASYISITSFNEWHEGTQIEPAVSKKCDAFEYLDYKPLADDYYLIRTAYWVDEFRKARSASEDVQ